VDIELLPLNATMAKSSFMQKLDMVLYNSGIANCSCLQLLLTKLVIVVMIGVCIFQYQLMQTRWLK